MFNDVYTIYFFWKHLMNFAWSPPNSWRIRWGFPPLWTSHQRCEAVGAACAPVGSLFQNAALISVPAVPCRSWTILSSKWGTHRRRVVGLGRLRLEMTSSFEWVQLTSSPLSPGWIREVSSPLADTTPPHDGNLAANHLWSAGLHGFTWCHFCEDEKQR